MKRYCLVTFAFCVFFNMSVHALDVTIDEVNYTLDVSSRTAKVTGSSLSNVVIPETIENDGILYNVTAIGKKAFRFSHSLKTIKTGNSILTLEEEAFSNANYLERVDFGNSLEIIEYMALEDCDNLKYIVIPNSIISIATRGLGDTDDNKQLVVICLRQDFYVPQRLNVIYPSSFFLFENNIYTYNGKVPEVNYSFNGIGFGFQPTKENMDDLVATAGKHTVNLNCSFANDDMSFDVKIPYDYTINPVTLMAKVKDASRLYGDVNPQFTTTYSGFVNNEDASVITSNGSYTTSATAKSDVGTYAIKQSGATAQNYVFEYEDGILTVGKAPLTMTANNKNMAYGDKVPTLNASYEGLKNNETQPVWTTEPKFTTTATSASKVGTYPITISNADTKNYQLTVNDGTLTIDKAELTVSADNKKRTYGDENPEFTLTYTGLKNSETVPEWEKKPVVETTADVMSPIGSYDISVKDAVAVNYDVTAVNGKLTINRAELQVTPKDATRKYGEDNPMFELSYVGLKNNETEPEWTTEPQITTIATNKSSVGEYSIQLTTAVTKNYILDKKVGKLTITKAPLVIGINNYSRKYGENNSTFQLYYNGLKNDEVQPEWVSLPTITTEATTNSDVGKYDIIMTGGQMRNYEATEVIPGKLTVTPASLTIKAKNVSRLYFEDNPKLSYECTGLVGGDGISVLSPEPQLITTATKQSKVGIYPIEIGGAEAKNYEISYENGQLTINKCQLTVSTKDCMRAYGEDNPIFELSYTGFVDKEDENVLISKPKATTTATKTSDVGTYPITLAEGSADNYTFSYTSGILTINKAEQTISWEQDLTGLKVGDQVELKAKASSSLPITYSLDNSSAAEVYTSGSKSYLDCKAGGQFLMRAVQNGNKNYYSSPKASNTVSIVGTNPASDPTLTIKQADNGSVKVQVSKGSVYTFIMAPSNGWKVHSVTFNNSDVTNQLSSDEKFTTPAITSNSILSVVYEQGSSAVNAAKVSEVKVQATSSGIRVVDAIMGDVVRVYSLDGQLKHSVIVDGQTVDIPLLKHDVYVVKVAGKTVKLGF